MIVSDAAFLLVVGVVFPAGIVAILLLNRWSRELDRLLRARHPEVLDALREQDSRHGNPDAQDSSYAMLRYLWRRDYRKLRDPEVARVAGRLRALVLAFASLLVLTMAGLSVDEAMTAKSTRAAQRAVAAARAPDERRELALDLHRKGRLAEAIRAYDELLGPVGADGELVYWRGMAHWKMGEEDRALADFRRVMDLEPGRIDAYLHTDRILSRHRRFDDCVELWTRYLRVVPDDATAHMERGGSHYHRGDFAAAYEDAKRACDLGKKEACPHAERMKARL
jgi:tetratricopeptide (TPR) repeat protein